MVESSAKERGGKKNPKQQQKPTGFSFINGRSFSLGKKTPNNWQLFLELEKLIFTKDMDLKINILDVLSVHV